MVPHKQNIQINLNIMWTNLCRERSKRSCKSPKNSYSEHFRTRYQFGLQFKNILLPEMKLLVCCRFPIAENYIFKMFVGN